MIALLMLASVAVANTDPTDWACADPLIAKNYRQNIASRPLAARIRDECSKPFVADPEHAGSTMQVTESSIYTAQSITYLVEIQNKIDALRRKRDIPLIR